MSAPATDKINHYLSKANIKFSGPISSYLLLRKPALPTPPSSTPDPDSDFAHKTYVIDHKNITNVRETTRHVLATVNACDHLCASIDPDSNLKLLRLQSDTSHSLLITVPALCCVGLLLFRAMMKKHAPSNHSRKYQQQNQQQPSSSSASTRPPSSLSRPTSSSAARAAATSRISATSRSKRPVSSSATSHSSSSGPLSTPTSNCAFTFSPIPPLPSNALHKPLVLSHGAHLPIKPRPLTEDDIDFIPDANTLSMLYNSNSINTPVKLSTEMEYESENIVKLTRDKRVQEMHNHYMSATDEEKRLLEAEYFPVLHEYLKANTLPLLNQERWLYEAIDDAL